MNGPALVVAAGAVVLAALAAAADGALLGGDPEPEPPAPTVGRLRPGERAHRALSLARVLAHLAAGAAIARGLDLTGDDKLAGVVWMIVAALVTVILVEGIARAIGFATAPLIAFVLSPLVSALEIVLAPVLRAGVALDALFERFLPPPTLAERAEQLEEAAEQFRQVVAAEADVSRDEEALLHGVFSLGDTMVRHHGAARGSSASARCRDEVVDRKELELRAFRVRRHPRQHHRHSVREDLP